MLRSRIVMGLLSAAMLTSTVVPSTSEVMPAPVMQREIPVIQDARAPSDASLPRLAQAGPAGNHERRPAPRPGDERAGPQRQDRNADRREPRDEQRAPRQSGLELAGQLAAAETYVGITGDQLNAWRAYSSALIAFVDHPERRGGPRGPRPEGGPATSPAESQKPQPDDAAARPFSSEQRADAAIAQAAKAETLKEAINGLRAVLGTEQLARLATAEEAFGPRHPPVGPQGEGDGHRGQPGEDAPQPPAAQ